MRNSQLAEMISDLRVQTVLMRDVILKVLKAFDTDKAAIEVYKGEIAYLRKQNEMLLSRMTGDYLSVPMSLGNIPLPGFDEEDAGQIVVDRNSNEPKRTDS